MNSSHTTPMQVSLSRVGLGYGIAIAVGILVVVSTIMLASYVCARVHQRTTNHGPGTSSSPTAAAGVLDSSAGGHFADWSSSRIGLDQITVESYPKAMYSSSQPPPDDPACSICLADYKEGDMLRLLPECRHAFHAPCVDAWLRLHASCPMCRTSPLPSLQATPLSELIPLARHQIRHTHS